MIAAQSRIIDDIITTEGGFVDHTLDRGGATKYGITALSWSEYCSKHRAVQSDVKNITVEQARSYYSFRFKQVKLAILPVRFWHPLADWEVNSGRYAISEFQALLNQLGGALKVDGYLGSVTAHEAQKHNNAETVNRYTAVRIKFYCDLVRDNPSQSVFLLGWITRAMKFFSWSKSGLED